MIVCQILPNSLEVNSGPIAPFSPILERRGVVFENKEGGFWCESLKVCLPSGGVKVPVQGQGNLG